MDYGAIVDRRGPQRAHLRGVPRRAGIPTLLLEARDEVGGCASTVDALGARVNICNCDHVVFRTTPVLDELGLAEHGLRYLDVEPARSRPHGTARPAWPVFHDVERTIDALELIHPDEVDGYRRYAEAAIPVAELVLEMACTPPTPGSVLKRLADRRGAGRGDAAPMGSSDGRRRAAVVLLARGDHGPRGDDGSRRRGSLTFAPRPGWARSTYAMKHAGAPEGRSAEVERCRRASSLPSSPPEARCARTRASPGSCAKASE